MSSSGSAGLPVAFVHGLWLHGESWSAWVDFFREKGYDPVAVNWPGDGATTEATRRNPAAVAGYGVRDIADHIAGQIRNFTTRPVLIGHSFGGLLVQNLLGRGLASAAIAIDPAPIRGVPELPLSALRSALPVLNNPLNYWRAVSLSEPQFRFGFTNALGEDEARALYLKYAMPAPGRPVFQAATASLNPGAATKIDASNPWRGPLLLVAGGKDHTVPPVLVRSALKVYRHSPAVTEFKEFDSRGHSLTIDSGWKEIAGYCLSWLNGKGF